MREWFFVWFVLIGVVGIVGIGVWIWALVDRLQVPDDSMYRTGLKLIWVLITVLAQVIGRSSTSRSAAPKGELG